MSKFKVFKNLNEFEIVEADSAVKAQWMCSYLPFRVIPCEDDGSVKIPEGHTIVEKQNNHTK